LDARRKGKMLIKPVDGIETKEVSIESAITIASFYAALENRYYSVYIDDLSKPLASVSPEALRKLKNERN
jgi:hypothetical protein